MGKRLHFGWLLLLLFAPSVWAQETPRIEVFGGYSYLNFDVTNLTAGNTAGLPDDRLNMNGWEASASFNVNEWFGVEGDFSGHYKGDCEGFSGLTCKDLSFMGGPRLTYRRDRYTAFAHALVGGDNGSGSFEGFSLSDTPFAWAAGGGVDYGITPHIAIRVAQVDYFMTRHALNLGAQTQNNFRVSAGIVFTLGGSYETSARVPRSNPKHAPSGTEEAPLLGVTGYDRGDGFMVDAVSDVSPAAAAGIRPGDVIMTIDAQPVHSAHDIESAIATSQTGTVRVMYFRSGVVQTEVNVKVR